MIGYTKKPPTKKEPVLELTWVGCSRCLNKWQEHKWFSPDEPRINGPMYIYDACENCIQDEEIGEYDRQLSKGI